MAGSEKDIKMRKHIAITISICLILISTTACSATALPDSLILQSERYPQYAKYLQSNMYSTYKKDEGEGSFGQSIWFTITKEDLSSIPYEDMQIFFHNLKYIYARKYDACTIVFGDGTGIRFEKCDPDNGMYGTLDYWYYVTDLKGIVTDTGSYLTLSDEDGNPTTTGQSTYGINGIGE